MKRRFLFALQLTLLLMFLINIPVKGIQGDSLKFKIQSIEQVEKMRPLPSGTYKEKYEVFFNQPVDYKNPDKAHFSQRVYVMHLGYDRPTIFVTEGYGGVYASNPRYREELSRILNANVVFVEHRYFLESTPSDKNWEYLTAENEAKDLHRIRKAFGEIYKGKWIVTGISKGGQNAVIYTSYFPHDMDFTVAYVAPFCKKVEDNRHESFISNYAGTQADRDKILNFQKELLKRRNELSPKFDSLCTAGKYKFNLPNEEIYDYSVLEFSFSFWQWGNKTEKIPDINSSADKIFKYWVNLSGPEYFVNDSPTTPFFIQAAKELGYYGYDIQPFKGLLKIKSSKGYMAKLFLPYGLKLKFSKSLYKKLSAFLKKTDNRIMFIYGQFDPWSSVKANEQNRDNIVFFIEPNGSHRSRITSLPEDMKTKAQSLLFEWLQQ